MRKTSQASNFSPLKEIAILPTNPFFIPAETVHRILQAQGLTIDEFLKSLISLARTLACAPISNYHVGIAALGSSGNIYLGVNVEFPGFPLYHSIHGEQFTIAHARNHGETEIKKIALSAAPCGHCRQFLNEMDVSGQLEILIPNHPPKPLLFFLPEAFGPKDLGLNVNPWNLLEEDIVHPFPLVAKALQAAGASHAPYSQAKAGIALLTEDGKIYSGGYIENAAFNPSLSPLQAALVTLLSDLRTYEEIAQVVLAERKDVLISHEETTRTLLKSIAPQAQFHVEEIE